MRKLIKETIETAMTLVFTGICIGGGVALGFAAVLAVIM